MYRSLYEAFCKTASEQAQQIAWLGRDIRSTQSIRWSELLDQVDRLALWLDSNGLKANDRVVNLEPNSHRWAILDLACAALGLIHSPIDPRWRDSQINSAIHSLEPKAVFSSTHRKLSGVDSIPIAQALERATFAPPEHLRNAWMESQRGDQTATILWTSGTSANPKGVMLSHNNLLSNALAKLEAMPQSPDDVRLNILPFAHAYARTCELTTWMLSGGAIACAESGQTALQLAPAIQPTLINAIPSIYQHWLSKIHQQQPGDQAPDLNAFLGGRVRQLASGGASIPDSIRDRFAQASLPIFQGYGLTEASPVVCSNRAARECDGKKTPALLSGVGPAVNGVQLRIDKDLRLYVRSPGVMQGYWRDELATASRIQDGWLDTGDCVAFDPCQTPNTIDRLAIGIAGRADDMQVLSTGHKFAPRLLEHPIEQIQGVCECVVVGTDLRRPIAIVSLTAEHSNLSPMLLLDLFRDSLKDQPEHLQIAQVVVTQEPWTLENGLRHWKGGVNRREIARRFAPQ